MVSVRNPTEEESAVKDRSILISVQRRRLARGVRRLAEHLRVLFTSEAGYDAKFSLRNEELSLV